MLKITKIFLFVIMFFSTVSYAEVATPLGIEPGKSTLKDVENKYKIIKKKE